MAIGGCAVTTTTKSSITRGWALWKVLSKALGIEGHHVTRLVLDLRVDGPPRIRITEYLDSDSEQELVRMFELAEWKEAEE